MHGFEWGITGLVYTAAIFWLGTKYGNKLGEDARRRLAEFENGAKSMGAAFKKQP